MASQAALPTLEDARAAARRIASIARRTPIETSRTLNRLAGRELFFKCENLQRIGAFKIRGATNMIARLSDQEAARGVVTQSSGNHGQAVALAAKLRGIPAHVVMPENSSPVKIRAVEGYGADVVLCEPTLEAREVGAERILAETGAVYIPPYDHPEIVAGQATATLELLEQVPGLDVVVTPVGGGGLAAGACLAASGAATPLRVIGAEPRGADDAARSLAAGRLIPQTAPETIADGLRSSLGQVTWAILRRDLERIVTVGEAEIIAAMRLVWERMKLIIEPSAAVAVAAVLGDEMRGLAGARRVGVILSGGNLDLDNLPWSG
jgi:threonine dehydratase/serine racemase